MKWSLFDNKNEFLEPLIFSNGKSQLDIVKEVIKAIKEGNKIIFIKGVCGTGKSAVALNVAKEIEKTSIVVPVKALQKQYEEDYTNKLYLLKENNEKLKITVITGRNNHKCVFNNFDCFDCSCDNKFLPCTIAIQQKNIKEIWNFINQNPFVKVENFENLNDVKRNSIAPACPHWSPIVPAYFGLNFLKDAKPEKYLAIKNITYKFYKRKQGCGYYDQFNSYINSDVIIFNSKKYELENLMNRKPLTEIEIIDECDEFLDNLCREEEINLDRLSKNLINIKTKDLSLRRLAIEINDLVVELLKDNEIKNYIDDEKILQIKETKIFDLLKYLLDNPELIDIIEDEEFDYLYKCYEIAASFKNYLDETYLGFYKSKNEDLIVKLVTINLEKKLKELLDKNKVFVMMSGTIHNEKVLKEIFGIKDFKIVEAETKNPGTVTKIYTKLEKNFRHKELEKGKVTRKQYLKALSKCIEKAKKPILVQVNSFYDLPTKEECKKFKINNIKTREELKKEQEEDKEGNLVQKFKAGKIGMLYSTKTRRGVDFPGKICNSIIFTKYPYPDISSIFWKVLRKSKPMHFNSFYFDKAKREFLQQLYRGLRFENDHVFLLSPDSRILEENI